MLKKIAISISLLALACGALAGYAFYSVALRGVALADAGRGSLYIADTATWPQVDAQLRALLDANSTRLWPALARHKRLEATFRPGHYTFRGGETLNAIANRLKAGGQTPVKVVFNTLAGLDELAGVVATQLMADSAALARELRARRAAAGDSAEVFAAHFLPNTYQMYWTTSPAAFVDRMLAEHRGFWTAKRQAQARKLGMTPVEVSILASIVEKETAVMREMPMVAGVYLNRLRRGMPLQADPTVIFAAGDPEVRRVTTRMTQIESPYNTYRHTGLPPGPICLPSTQAIEAVLAGQSHGYIYFCASPELDGTHVFAKTLKQHNQNARLYQQKLNQLRIYR